MYRAYEVRFGRRTVARKKANTAQEAVIDYLRSFGCHGDELVRMGADAVAWRGAVYRAVLATSEKSNDA